MMYFPANSKIATNTVSFIQELHRSDLNSRERCCLGRAKEEQCQRIPIAELGEGAASL